MNKVVCVCVGVGGVVLCRCVCVCACNPSIFLHAQDMFVCVGLPLSVCTNVANLVFVVCLCVGRPSWLGQPT